MNIHNFSSVINPIIVDRGLDIYDDEQYSGFSKEEDTYTMIAHGTRDYFVQVTLNGMTIEDFDCDCPYDHGPVCKHVVALLFAITGGNGQEEVQPTDEPGLPLEPKEEAPPRIDTIIASLERKTLESYLIHQAHRDPNLYKTLVFRFAEDDQKVKTAYLSARSAIRLAEMEYFDYDYEDEESVMDEAWESLQPVFDEAEDEKTAPSLSVKLLNAVLEVSLEPDDFESDFPVFMMEEAIAKLRSLASRWKGDILKRKEAYETMEMFYKTNPEDVLGFGSGEYLSAMGDLECAEYKDQFLDLLKALENDQTLSGMETQNIEIAMYHHLNTHYDENTSRNYLHKHLDNSVLLEIAYHRAMAEGDYPVAIKCAKSIVQSTNIPWQTDKYEKWLLEALIKHGDHENAKPILKSRILKGDSEALDKYESYFEGEPLKEEMDGLLETLRRTRTSDAMAVRIAHRYKRTEALMEYVETYPSSLLGAYPSLPSKYSEKVYSIFRQLVFKVAETAHNRKQYHEVARILHHARKALEERADTIEKDLLALYPRKSALKDEIKKYRI